MSGTHHKQFQELICPTLVDQPLLKNVIVIMSIEQNFQEGFLISYVKGVDMF